MFSQLPKLFDRDFAIGYFLPTTLWLLVSLALWSEFGLPLGIFSSFQDDLLKDATLIVLVSWLLSIFWLTLNRPIYQFMEGYGTFNPLRFLERFEKRRFKQLQEAIEQINKECLYYVNRDSDIPAVLQNRRETLYEQLALRFPDAEIYLLPTPFGNTIRAFEVYPRVMYGIEAIQGWDRLLGVIPKDYQELIDASKAEADFWLNLGILSVVTIVEYVVLCFVSQGVKIIWFPVIATILIVITYYTARYAAEEWGISVRAAFDLFLPELSQKLGLARPNTRAAERKLWTDFSLAILYRMPECLPEFTETYNEVELSEEEADSSETSFPVSSNTSH